MLCVVHYHAAVVQKWCFTSYCHTMLPVCSFRLRPVDGFCTEQHEALMRQSDHLQHAQSWLACVLSAYSGPVKTSSCCMSRAFLQVWALFLQNQKVKLIQTRFLCQLTRKTPAFLSTESNFVLLDYSEMHLIILIICVHVALELCSSMHCEFDVHEQNHAVKCKCSVSFVIRVKTSQQAGALPPLLSSRCSCCAFLTDVRDRLHS